MINNPVRGIRCSQNEEDFYSINKLFRDKHNNLCKGLDYFYYSNMKNHVKNYQNIWNFIVQNKKKLAKGRELEEHYVSLSEQCAYLLFDYDQIVELERKVKPDNDDVFLMAYFTYNLILSAKSILDVFAWIIKEAFLAKVDLMPIEVSIIFKNYCSEKEKHKKFKKACKDNLDVKFYEYLCSDYIQAVFANLEKHRDIVSHKGKIHIMCHDNKDIGKVTIVKPKNPEVFRTIGFDELHKKPGGENEFETCSQFANGIIANLDGLFIQVNDSVLRRLNKLDLKQGVTKATRIKIEKST